MKYLITGGAGFIGSAVIRHILDNGVDQVVNVDKLTYASTWQIFPANLQIQTTNLNKPIYVTRRE